MAEMKHTSVLVWKGRSYYFAGGLLRTTLQMKVVASPSTLAAKGE